MNKPKTAATLNQKKDNFLKDLLAGLITAAVSIPISMGYAQISGLPAVYGLYGSVFPIIIFTLLTTSRQFIFGVDTVAALMGGVLLDLGIAGGSPEALEVVPLITILASVWLMLFYILRAERLLNYISAPVIGGFISGICIEIILMQLPHLLGGQTAEGKLPELLKHLISFIPDTNVPSLVIGIVALGLMFLSKKYLPKFPMAVILLIAGAMATAFLPIREWGVQTLAAVEPGLPTWDIPKLVSYANIKYLFSSLSVAIVIVAETLLPERSFARNNGRKLDDHQEILAFSLGNLVAALTGCCPVSGSVPRTILAERYQSQSKRTGLIAGITMIPVLLFAADFIEYLPVPILTAIIIFALTNATEFHLARRLWKVSRKECLIFVAAFFGVLLFGVINGVLIGVILSFAEMIIRMAKPSTAFLGIQPGHRHFHDVKNNNIYPVQGVLIYRFSSSLFFTNVSILEKEIDDHIKEDTRAVIIDASGINSIDITAAETLEHLYRSLKKRGIHLYLTEHTAGLNNQLRNLELGYLIEEGAVRRTIHVALKDLGINRPYPLEGADNLPDLQASKKRVHNRVQEFTWAYGKNAEEMIEKQLSQQIELLRQTGNIEELFHSRWGHMEKLDENAWLEHLEEHIKELVSISGKDEETLLRVIDEHRRGESSSIVGSDSVIAKPVDSDPAEIQY